VELANGMAEFITGRVPARALDFEAYNRNAIAEFYDAVSLAPASQPSERSRRPI
jgi:hypothetical protein